MVQDPRLTGAPFKRLFFALPVTDAQQRAIAQWRRGLQLRSGKPVPSTNFHLTLMFLGDVDAVQVPAICAAVDNLARPDAPCACCSISSRSGPGQTCWYSSRSSPRRRCANLSMGCSRHCCPWALPSRPVNTGHT